MPRSPESEARRRQHQATPEYRAAKREYDRQRYLTQGPRPPQVPTSQRREYWRDYHQRMKSDPLYLERKRRTAREHARIAIYGTANPTPGQASLDGTRHWKDPTWKPSRSDRKSVV